MLGALGTQIATVPLPHLQVVGFPLEKLLRNCPKMDLGIVKSRSQCCLLIVILTKQEGPPGKITEAAFGGSNQGRPSASLLASR